MNGTMKWLALVFLSALVSADLDAVTDRSPGSSGEKLVAHALQEHQNESRTSLPTWLSVPKFLLDTVHSAALSVIKSPAYCVLALSALAQQGTANVLNTCPNHVIDSHARSAITRLWTICSEMNPAMWRSPDTFHLFRMPQGAQESYSQAEYMCRYKACNRFALPDFGFIGNSYWGTAAMNQCFAQNFCEKKGRVVCAGDFDTEICPGLCVNNTDLPEARSMQFECYNRHYY